MEKKVGLFILCFAIYVITDSSVYTIEVKTQNIWWMYKQTRERKIFRRYARTSLAHVCKYFGELNDWKLLAFTWSPIEMHIKPLTKSFGEDFQMLNQEEYALSMESKKLMLATI